MSDHTVRTTHIQHLIENGLNLARQVDGMKNGTPVGIGTPMPGHPGVEVSSEPRDLIDVLEKAAADLRHAAEELTAERLSLLGWKQV